jgi:Mrp family chromosome partitioning ATPase
LTVHALRGLIEGLRSLYNWIVIDTPPVAAVADALIVSQIIDGAIVVAGAEMVPTKAVRQTLERVGETGARILGIVLNRARIERHSYYYGSDYGHYYGAYREDTGPRDAAAFPKRAAR